MLFFTLIKDISNKKMYFEPIFHVKMYLETTVNQTFLEHLPLEAKWEVYVANFR